MRDPSGPRSRWSETPVTDTRSSALAFAMSSTVSHLAWRSRRSLSTVSSCSRLALMPASWASSAPDDSACAILAFVSSISFADISITRPIARR